MTVFVTGGAGFVGAHVVRALLDDGLDVVCYDDMSNGSLGLIAVDDRNLHVVVGDVRDQEALGSALASSGADTIVHLAAIHFIPYCNAHPRETFSVNVEGTLALVEVAKQHGVRRVVVASTAAVYPIQAEPCQEDQPTWAADVYGASKVATEALSQRLASETGTSVACARLFNVFGPGETNPHVIPTIVEQLARGGPVRLGNLSSRRDYVHVRDVAKALCLLAAMDNPGWQAYNVGTQVEWSVDDIMQTLAELRGRPIEVQLDERALRASDRPHLLADVSKLRATLGWAPATSLREGLAELLEVTR